MARPLTEDFDMMKNLLRKTLPALALAAAATAAQAADPTLLGDVLAANGGFTLTTAFNADDDAPFNLSGSPAVWIDTLELAAGLPFHALDLLDEPAYEGSLARQSFAVQAGDILSFSWSFGTQETLFQDRAFVVLNGQLVTLATRGSATPGVQSFSHTFGSSGTATLSFGVVDTGDFNGVSTLTVSSVTLAPVPEPAGWALWLAGVAGLATLRRRAQR
jgi:MYXO-CTERM domain-containing protein